MSLSLEEVRQALHVGDQVRLDSGPARWWWTVQAISEHFAACVHQVPFQPAGSLCYTVLDWRRARRGPCNLIGQGFGDGTYSRGECDAMLAAFERHLTLADRLAAAGGALPYDATNFTLEVSHRNNVPLELLEVRR